MTRTTLRLPLALACLLALSACSSDPEDSGETTAETAAETDVSDETPAADTGPDADADASADDLAADDVPRIEAGLVAENEVLTQAADEIAKGVDDLRFAALALSALEDSTQAGARAADMADHRYGRLKEEVYTVLGNVEMRAMLRRQMDETDTTGLDDATLAKMQEDAQAMIDSVPDPFADMDPALAEALREREARLMELRAKNVALLVKISQN
jgi:hypothetical protein